MGQKFWNMKFNGWGDKTAVSWHTIRWIFCVWFLLLFSGVACSADSQVDNMDETRPFFYSASTIPLFFRKSCSCLRCSISDIGPITELPCYLWETPVDFTYGGRIRNISEGICSNSTIHFVLQFVTAGAGRWMNCDSLFMLLFESSNVLQSLTEQITQPCVPTQSLFPQGGKCLLLPLST